MTKEKRPMGRPSKYRPEYCELALEVVGRNAKTIDHLADRIGVHVDTLYEWQKVHPEFSEALRLAVQKAKVFWMDELSDNLMRDKNANAPLVKLYFANRFGMHDKQQVDHTSSDKSMTPKPDRIIIEGVDVAHRDD